MFDTFIKHFNLSKNVIFDSRRDNERPLPNNLLYLLQNFGGTNINNGLYKIHTIDSSVVWAKNISELFTDYANLIYPFSFDWMGRQFCLDKQNPNKIYMFDPATVEDFELETDLVSFHDIELVEDTDNMLSQDNFFEILPKKNIQGINYNECFSHTLPLLLNGDDSDENLEVSDIDVFWHFQSQIYNQIKDLPSGTQVNLVTPNLNKQQ